MIKILSQQGGDESAINRRLHSSRNFDEPKAKSTAELGQRPDHRIGTSEASQLQSESPAHLAISLIQGKWKLRILSQLQRGPVRLSQLRRMFPDASKKMLAQHLREMEDDGIIVRSDLSDRRLHVEYSLGTSLGAAVLHLIDTLAEWGAQHAPRLSRQISVRDWPDEKARPLEERSR
jgi:DNA-binding HxlR family transcriptional regulator